MFFRFVLIAYAIALTVLSLFSLNRYVLIALFRKYRDARHPAPPAPDLLPIVTLQLPVFNEMYVVERLIASACALDYPRDRLQIQVLDDSTDETLALTRALAERYRAQGVWIEHYHRTERTGYKAGALEYGMHYARGELIALFDADFVIPADFLRRTVTHFADPQIGIVQARWSYINELYSPITRATALGLDAQFVIEQPARDWGGLFMSFNGTAAVLRATCVSDAGGWQHDTITEDLDLSYRAQLRGWRIRYLTDLDCPSEIPPDMLAIKAQQFRWVKGSQETARKILPRLWASEVSRWHKIQGTLHLVSNSVYPFLLLVGVLNPLAMLAASQQNLRMFWPLSAYFLLSLCGTFSYYIAAERALYGADTYAWVRRAAYFPIFLCASLGLAVSNSRGAIEGLIGHASPFERTPKYRITEKRQRWLGARYSSRTTVSTFIELLMTVYSLGAAVYAVVVREYAAIPFLLIFGFGYAIAGGCSLYTMVAHARMGAVARRAELRDRVRVPQIASPRPGDLRTIQGGGTSSLEPVPVARQRANAIRAGGAAVTLAIVTLIRCGNASEHARADTSAASAGTERVASAGAIAPEESLPGLPAAEPGQRGTGLLSLPAQLARTRPLGSADSFSGADSLWLTTDPSIAVIPLGETPDGNAATSPAVSAHGATGELRFRDTGQVFEWGLRAHGLAGGRAYRVEIFVDGAPYDVASARADSAGTLRSGGRLITFRNLVCVGSDAPPPRSLRGAHEIRAGIKDDGSPVAGTAGGGGLTGIGGPTLPCSGNGDHLFGYRLRERLPARFVGITNGNN